MTRIFVMRAEEVAKAAVALCGGQVLTVDRGATFFDNLMRLYGER